MKTIPCLLLLGCGALAQTAGAQCAIKDKIMAEGQLTTADELLLSPEPQQKTAPSKPAASQSGRNDFDKIRFGGYGEAVAAWKNYGINRFYGSPEGNPHTSRSTISIPRLVFGLDYKFSPKWQLSTEIEFEAGGTGQALELENSENGEYETELEKGGEVAVEQFHLTRFIHRGFNLRAGHMIVPVGLTNHRHEPIQFFGTVRPEGETTILPSTWHETGVAAFGSVGHGLASFNYEAMVVAGLNANGFDRNTWVAGGKQGYFEADNFNSPAYVARLDWVGVSGLRVGMSYYYCHDTSANSDKAAHYGDMGRAPLSIFTADAQYSHRYFTARGNIVTGHLDNASAIAARNVKQPNASPYSKLTPIATRAVSYAGEIGARLRGIFGSPSMPDIIPFVRYEYYNPQEKVEGLQVADARLKTSMWTMGANYRVGNGIVLKADYTTRSIGGGRFNSENEFALGIAFTTWFWKK